MFPNPIFSEPLPSTSANYVPVLPEDRRKNSAKQSAFFFKPEKIRPNHTLFLDVGMIDLVKLPGEKTHRKHPGEVAIVDDSGDLILWARVKIAHEDVCNYFTAISGIEPRSLANATPFFIVKPAIEYLLETAYLVGLNLQSDLNCLGIQVADEYKEDLQKTFVDYNNQPYSLRTLSYYCLCKESFQTGAHSAMSDARATKALYKMKSEIMGGSHNLELERLPKIPFIGMRGCKCKKR